MIPRRTATTDPATRRRERVYRLGLLLILLVAAALRLTGLDWDNGRYLHPDERFMVMVTVDTQWPTSLDAYFDSETSPLNPYNTRHGTFVYGTFPLFLTKATSGLFDADTYGQAHIAGRTLSALSDVGTVFLVAWIARRFFGHQAGLLAGFLIAATMLNIQSAHFYTVDAMSVFFATATFAAILKGWDAKSIRWFAVAGLVLGLAGASKPNYLIALGFLTLPVLETLRLHGIDGLFPSRERRVFPVIPAVIVAGLVAFWTFRLGQPYAFAGPHIWNIGLNEQWVNDLRYWSTAQSGLIDIKSSVQWVGRAPIAYIVQNMVAWGMGPPLGLASLAALGLGLYRLLRSRSWPNWWLAGMLGWSLIQLVLYGTNIAQAQRYLLPIYPFLVVLAAGLLMELAGRFGRRHTRRFDDASRHVPGTVRAAGPGTTRRSVPPWANPGTILIAVTVIYTAFYAVAFTTLYVRPLSRVQASEWIYENIPAGSTLTHEYWDDALPIPLEGEDAYAYEVITLDLYGFEGQGSTKLSEIIGQLNQADYIILSSNRIIGSVPRQPERYPMATHYYEMLVDGSLGFDLVADFSQVPELFGIEFDDTNAEETITVYEHPYVRIFQKTDRFDVTEVYTELETAMGYGGVNYLPGDPVGDQMFLTGEERSAYDEAGTWSSIFDPDSWIQQAPAVWWYVGMQVLAVPAIPLAWAMFRRFPDRGYGIAKALGLVLVTWIAWLLSSVGLLPFGRGTIVLAWLVVAGASALLVRNRWRAMLDDLAGSWRWIAGAETIFLAAFAVMAWLRSHNAAFWTPGGTDETAWSLAMFNAAVRSPSFPPFDGWLSGGQLHLPYWGMMPWVLLTRLTGIVPNVAYTLIFAGLFAAMCVTLWSATAAMIERVTMKSHESLAHGYRSHAALWTGSSVDVSGTGPETTKALDSQSDVPAGWMALLAPVLVGVAGTLGVAARAGRGEWGYIHRPPDWPIGGLAGDILYGIGNVLTQRPDVGIGVATGAIGRTGSFITPFTSLVTGNLSPDATTLPLLALALAIGVAITHHDDVRPRDWQLIGLLIAAGVVTGVISASATWGMLLTAALMVIAITVQAIRPCSREHTWPLVRGIALRSVTVVAVAYVASLPFRQDFRITGRNTISGPAISLEGVLLAGAGFLAIIAIYLLAASIRVIGETRQEGLPGRIVAILTVLVAVSAAGAAFLVDSGTIFILVIVLFVFITLWHRQNQPTHLLLLGTIGLAAVTALYASLAPMPMNPFGGNSGSGMETAIWMLAGFAATVLVAWLAGILVTPESTRMNIAGGLTFVLLLLLATGMVASPLLTVSAVRNNAAGLSLDATAFLETIQDPEASAQDRDAARWLMENVAGLPVVLEAPGGAYLYSGRISAMTGLPTVIGWTGPERLTRPGWEQVVSWRQDAVNEIYGSMGTFASVEPLLMQYDVHLIYVGPLERRFYDPLALHKFEDAASSGELEVVYRQGDVVIYGYRANGEYTGAYGASGSSSSLRAVSSASTEVIASRLSEMWSRSPVKRSIA